MLPPTEVRSGMCRRGSHVVGNVSQFLLAVWRQVAIDVTMHIGGFVLITAFTGPLSAAAAHAAGLSHGTQPAVRMPSRARTDRGTTHSAHRVHTGAIVGPVWFCSAQPSS